MTPEKSNVNNRVKMRKLIHLDPEDAAFVKSAAAQRNVSQSEIIRESIKKFKADDEQTEYDPIEDLIGKVKAGKNQAVKHDEALYE